MSRYIQLHILTSYPAANLNRDDLGRPKTMTMGNTQRLRVSSQSLKRAWRTSDAFAEALGGALGTRTKEIGKYAYKALTCGVTLHEAIDGVETGGLSTLKENKAVAIGRAIGSVFGKIKAKYEKKKDDVESSMKALLESLETEQIVHLSPAEIEGVAALVEVCRASGKVPEGEALDLLRADAASADMALFGRMLAASKRFNVEAAAQVAHAFTVHTAAVEEDFFTAVDDLNKEDAGAGHMGVAEFGAGLFYLYVCIDRELLRETLGDDNLTARTLRALVEAACTVSPTGKQNSFASRAYASFCLAEKGDEQPRSLAAAFLKPLNSEKGDLLADAVERLLGRRDSLNSVYGQDLASECFNVADGGGSLRAVCGFIAE
ncbi:type I-E CRISPR-associated protein Cas7/Cse4/CasC [Paucidesulfovibrio longus]|uniref:type I-E CRISPR-associated protein Cas7/Cse4/CasC n=1 Tax=Paucidesulfovibrio longus TaxID=889 RepID=UPI0003B4C706|nr:type I-E CRISPR-associated protein Cas7/Cse4/CasC [Paucidesulfovibrio longus]